MVAVPMTGAAIVRVPVPAPVGANPPVRLYVTSIFAALATPGPIANATRAKSPIVNFLIIHPLFLVPNSEYALPRIFTVTYIHD